MLATLVAALALVHVVAAQPRAVAPPGSASAVAPAAGDADVTQLRIVDARLRFRRALDAESWDREALGTRAAADGLTADLLPLLARPDSGRIGAEALLAELAGEPLGPYLHAQPEPSLALTVAYLRYHDDPALAAALDRGAAGTAARPSASQGVSSGWLTLAARHRAAAAPRLAAALTSAASLDQERVCDAALALPRQPRTAVAASLVAAWPADMPDDLGAACVALGAQLRPGRARLAAWLAQRQVREMLTTPWAVMAMLALAGTEQHALAARLGGELAPLIARTRFEWQLRGVSEVFRQFVGYLPLDAPATRAAVGRLAGASHGAPTMTTPVRLRARDPALVTEALELLRGLTGGAELLAEPALVDAIGVLGVAAGRTPAEFAAARARLVAIREAARAHASVAPFERTLDAWVTAMDTVAECRGARACLAGLLIRGSDAAVARAAYALGPAGLAALAPAEVRPVVRRLVMRPDPWMLRTVLASLRGCPRAWRGLREVLLSSDGADPATGLRSFLLAFDRTCAEAP